MSAVWCYSGPERSRFLFNENYGVRIFVAELSCGGTVMNGCGGTQTDSFGRYYTSKFWLMLDKGFLTFRMILGKGFLTFRMIWCICMRYMRGFWCRFLTKIFLKKVLPELSIILCALTCWLSNVAKVTSLKAWSFIFTIHIKHHVKLFRDVCVLLWYIPYLWQI